MIVIILILIIGKFELIWNPPFLFTAMNITFLTIIMFFVSILAVRSYLFNKSITIILLGSGTLALGFGGLLAGFEILGNNINSTVTIYNTSALVAGFFILTSAFLSIKKSNKLSRTKFLPLILYPLVIVLIILISYLIQNHIWPQYFIQGAGPTIMDITVLYTTIILFGISALLLIFNSDNSDLNFRRWYGLGLGLISIGLFAVSIQISVGDPLNWIGRISQYLGAVYILIAIITSIRETGIWMLPWEEALHETEVKYRRIVETAFEGIMITNNKGIITFVNPRMAEMLGYATQELIGMDGTSLIYPDELNESFKRIKNRDNGVKEEYDLKFRRKDGKKLWVHVTGSPIYDKKGRHIGNLGMYTDITSRKKAEKKLISTINELKRSNHELEQFAYVASHDLQEPLRMVSLFSQLLSKRYKNSLDNDADEFIDFIIEGSQRMKDLIDDLLDYSRVTSNAKEFERVDLENVLTNVLSNLSMIIEENDAIVTHEPLPIVFVDKSQIEQVFQNLISNGIKFHGNNKPEIHISALNDGNQWIFSVKDNGIGIDHNYQEKIFDVFKRLHTRENYPGSGIGLSICLKIIHRHGGKIWVESEIGNGSTFYFTIPKT
jgi:PAS domain S-box-containing protein